MKEAESFFTSSHGCDEDWYTIRFDDSVSFESGYVYAMPLDLDEVRKNLPQDLHTQISYVSEKNYTELNYFKKSFKHILGIKLRQNKGSKETILFGMAKTGVGYSNTAQSYYEFKSEVETSISNMRLNGIKPSLDRHTCDKISGYFHSRINGYNKRGSYLLS